MVIRKLFCVQGTFRQNNLRCFFTSISDEVAQAFRNKKPVLALESTIITHGLPIPENLKMAQSIQQICRDNYVTPATIALLNGKISVGMNDEELKYLSNGSKNYVKISRRDLAPSIQQCLTGGTTVSGTMLLANQHGIDVFATGGIGGVHRGGQDSLDISADLMELGRTPVAVVCAGVKSILDIPKTLEFLETQGVTVVTFGKTREFPAFFTANSGCLSHSNVHNSNEAAELIYVNKKLNLGSGIVIAVPIPDEFAADGNEIESAIQTALLEAEGQKIVGHAITPFILKRVSELTDGRSLQTNLALVRNNVLVGSLIATELNHLMLRDTHKFSCNIANKNVKSKILVVGALNFDIMCTKYNDISAGKDLADGQINPVLGGVARNVAECLARCGVSSSFISVIGNDKLGKIAIDLCQDSGMVTDGIKVIDGISTPVAQLLLKDGNVLEGIADFSSHSYLTENIISDSDVKNSDFVILDCDTPLTTGLNIAEQCSMFNVPLIIEPTAPSKFQQFVDSGILKKTSMITPNVSELSTLFGLTSNKFVLPASFNVPEQYSKIVINMLQCLECLCCTTSFRSVLTTIGEEGVLYCLLSSDGLLQIFHLPSAPEKVSIKSSSGAGDSFFGGFFAAFSNGHSSEYCLKIGTVCAWKSLQSFDTVSPDIDIVKVVRILEEWEGMNWDAKSLYCGKFDFEHCS